jgi:hypothetical protein
MRGAMLRLVAGPLPLGLLCASCSSKSSPACPDTCNADEPAIIELCAAAHVVGASVSGACSLLDAGEADASPVSGSWVFVTSLAPGHCDITFTYASGGTSSLAVTFASETPPEPAGCPVCPSYLAPTQSLFSVGSCIAGSADAAGD